jgi:4-amino-4-deoxy-L-arabinose transferase-like glycosyltransferase
LKAHRRFGEFLRVSGLRFPLGLLSLFLLCLGVALLIRSLYVGNVLDLDEGTYLSVGMIISRGGVVYRDVYESKPPLFLFISALVSYLGSGDVGTARLFIVVVASATSVVLYLVLRGISERRAVVAAILFAVFSSVPALGGFKVLTEPFSVLWGVTAIYFLLRALVEGRGRLFFLGGFFLGAYVLTRPTAVILGGVLLVATFFVLRRGSGRAILPLAAGGLVLPLFFLGYFAANGALGEMVYWVLEPISGFTSVVVASISGKVSWFLDAFLATLPLWVLALVGVLGWRRTRLDLVFVAWGVGLMVAFVLPFLPVFPHYYYELLPPLSVLASGGLIFLADMVGSVLRGGGSSRSGALLAAVLVLLVAVPSCVSVGWNVYGVQTLLQRDDVRLVGETANAVRASGPGENLLVVETGWPEVGPYLYYVTGRVPPIPNLFFFPWTISDSQVEMVKKVLQSGSVDCVVFIGPEPSFPGIKSWMATASEGYQLSYESGGNYHVYINLPTEEIRIWVYRRV